MLVIGIESSAHTFGVGIVKKGKVLANQKRMYPISDKGLIPAEVAEFHVDSAPSVISRAMEQAGISPDEINGVGYTKGPGLGPCLEVGMLAAKALALKLDVPIAAVNHGVGHVEITRHFSRMNDPVALYVSGGNSQILKIRGTKERRYRVMGETFDIGVGNMLDTFARSAGLKPAWGSTVAKAAESGKYVELPYTVKGMDFAFSGLLTKATGLLKSERVEDLCHSMQEVAFAMLCEATERALLLTGSKELCVCGGVAQSARLKGMLAAMSAEHGIRFGHAENEYNSDNGAMIAYVAERMLSEGRSIRVQDCDIQQRYRIEDAVVPA